ncbi:MAG TPA: tyrosine-protein phosphatase [Vicinamibacterales bacterium]|jgi:protein-tyrosine phosphatase|nr:tyrosine-protein phosphatase [Vicinamibacterales bacterium]
MTPPVTARLTRTSAAVLFVFSSFVTLGAAPAGSGHGTTTTAAVATAPIHIDNFGRISATYYRGAQPDGRDYKDLAALGVKTVINLTSDDALAEEPGMVAEAGMKYVALPMTTRVPPTQEQLAQFLKIVNDPASQPVFVHCVGGKHRTGVMTAVYRMTQHSWTADQAFNEMKHFKFGASMLHPEFKKFVYSYRAPAAAPKLPTVLAIQTQG